MEKEINIRFYQPQDRQILEQLAIEVQEHERSLDKTRAPGKSIVKRHVDRLLKPIETKTGFVLMAEIKGVCVGYLTAKKEQDFMNTYATLYIDDIGVTKTQRGKGIGTLLLKEAERLTKTIFNLDHITIGVLTSNKRVHEFYKRFGFQDHEMELVKKL